MTGSRVTALTLVGILGTLSWAVAQKTRTPNSKSMLNKADRTFVTKAANGGMFEVESSQLALKQASSDGVKQFAQRMVDDHAKANDELKQIAQSKGITLPAETDSYHKGVLNKLSNLHGAAFDRTYIKAQREAHKAAVSLFRSEAGKGAEADFKSFASKTLPTLEEHSRMALALSGTGSKGMEKMKSGKMTGNGH
jgi:putative membrane protein